jgi:hypothetical protein
MDFKDVRKLYEQWSCHYGKLCCRRWNRALKRWGSSHHRHYCKMFEIERCLLHSLNISSGEKEVLWMK